MGPFELAVVLFLFLLLFGASRLPKVGRGLGEAVQTWRNQLDEHDQ